MIRGAEKLTRIRVALVGVGNSASALIQGVQYYKDAREDITVPGLMHVNFGGYHVRDVSFVAAFEVNKKKIGKDLAEAIFTEPNCCAKFADVPPLGVRVSPAPIMDGVADHMKETFSVYKEDEIKPVDVAETLKKAKAEILVNYLPVGSKLATRFYAQAALDAGCAFVNCMPEFIASDSAWGRRFEERGKTKRISKTEAVTSLVPYDLPTRIGPSDYVPFLKNKKICYLWLKGRKFGDRPLTIMVKLEVEDSPNSAGVVIDVIRAVKIALERNIVGQLLSISSYAFKHPPIQVPDPLAKQAVEEFIQEK